MKKIICKVEYDTQTAQLIERATNGAFGEPTGYEECLYQTAEGKYFLYGKGGEESVYPQETIKRLSVAKAEEWLKANR